MSRTRMDYCSSEEETCLFAMKLVTASVLPAALRAAIDLDLLELIKKAGPAASVSPAELVAQIPTTNPEAATMVDRILRLLAANDILNCTVQDLPHGGVNRLYSLAPVCNYLTRNSDGVSLAPQLLMNTDTIFSQPRYHLKDAVIEGGLAFNIAHGMSLFELTAINPKANKLFNEAMSNQSTLIMNKILQMYNGFDGLHSLVDVGGGIGASIKLIVSKYPSIKAINFDLPHVIQHAPSHPGVEHIGGDMFVNVPKADAIFLKWVCHDWSDAECLEILKKCYEALPDNGKVIIAERIVPEIPNKALSSSFSCTIDLIMLSICPGGKERTEKEFQDLAKASGFKKFRKVCCSFTVWIMEIYK